MENRWRELKLKERLLDRALTVLKVGPKDLPRVIKRFLREVEEMERKLKLSKRS
jgi:hypothetical protein